MGLFPVTVDDITLEASPDILYPHTCYVDVYFIRTVKMSSINYVDCFPHSHASVAFFMHEFIPKSSRYNNWVVFLGRNSRFVCCRQVSSKVVE